MNLSIEKNVVIGEVFIEHSFKKFRENFEGTWIKAGHKVEINASNEVMICDSCAQDSIKRYQNWQSVTDTDMKHSYQVPTVTNPKDLYEWNTGRCQNNKRKCWGNEKKIFQVKREGERYLLSSCWVKSSVRENCARLV